jgi:hypothetical protein
MVLDSARITVPSHIAECEALKAGRNYLPERSKGYPIPCASLGVMGAGIATVKRMPCSVRDTSDMRRPTIFETIASRLLDRQGICVIWQLHLRASASHLDGNWLAAVALIAIADAAERQWAGRRR